MKGIYCIYCNGNQKIYIGQSIDCQRRFNEHIRKLNKGDHANPYLQHSWDFYGSDEFDFLILEKCDNLIEREKYWISYFNSLNKNYGFNVIPVRESAMMRQETREKISQSLKRFYSESNGDYHRETARIAWQKSREQIIESLIKAKQSLSYREKMRAIALARFEDKEQRLFMSKIAKDAWQDAKYRERQVKQRKEWATTEKGRKHIMQMVDCHTKESYDRTAESLKRKWQDEHFRQDMLSRRLPVSRETKFKHSERNRRLWETKEYQEKMQKIKETEEYKKAHKDGLCKYVYSLINENNVTYTFNSLMDASVFVKLPKTSLYRHVNTGKRYKGWLITKTLK